MGEKEKEQEVKKILRKCGTFLKATEAGIEYQLKGAFENEHTARVNSVMRDCGFRVEVEAGKYASMVTISKTLDDVVGLFEIAYYNRLVHRVVDMTVKKLQIEDDLREVAEEVEENVNEITETKI